MGEEHRESAEELRQHWDAMRRLGQAAPGTGLAASARRWRPPGRGPKTCATAR
jgi:hypothetical protein